jgi:putative toxin-antitoxin system antitoxin component (TIGR02293 family)
MARKNNNGSVLVQRRASGWDSLGLKDDSVIGLVKAIQSGFSFATLIRFQRQSGLALPLLVKVMHIPARTLARRKASGSFTPEESERLLRLATLFDKATGLFEGDSAAAVKWLQAPNQALGNRPPLELAQTEVGARAVEDLIGRLEFGVYS